MLLVIKILQWHLRYVVGVMNPVF